jgi:hypothetical protein
MVIPFKVKNAVPAASCFLVAFQENTTPAGKDLSMQFRRSFARIEETPEPAFSTVPDETAYLTVL